MGGEGARVDNNNKLSTNDQRTLFRLIVIDCQVVHQSHSVADRLSVRSMPKFVSF